MNYEPLLGENFGRPMKVNKATAWLPRNFVVSLLITQFFCFLKQNYKEKDKRAIKSFLLEKWKFLFKKSSSYPVLREQRTECEGKRGEKAKFSLPLFFSLKWKSFIINAIFSSKYLHESFLPRFLLVSPLSLSPSLSLSLSFSRPLCFSFYLIFCEILNG